MTHKMVARLKLLNRASQNFAFHCATEFVSVSLHMSQTVIQRHAPALVRSPSACRLCCQKQIGMDLSIRGLSLAPPYERVSLTDY